MNNRKFERRTRMLMMGTDRLEYRVYAALLCKRGERKGRLKAVLRTCPLRVQRFRALAARIHRKSRPPESGTPNLPVWSNYAALLRECTKREGRPRRSRRKGGTPNGQSPYFMNRTLTENKVDFLGNETNGVFSFDFNNVPSRPACLPQFQPL